MLCEFESVSHRICIELGVAFCKYGCTINSTEIKNENNENIIKIFLIGLPLLKVEDVIYTKL